MAVENSSVVNSFESLLSQREIECIIEKSLGSKVTILNYFIENYSSDKLGILGAHLNLIVEVSRGDGKEAHTFFLKTFPRDVKSQVEFLENSGLFVKEVHFYNAIMPELMASSEDKSWAPQCYLAKENCLVLENLKLKNYTLRGTFPSVQLLKTALATLAKIHATSLLAEKRLGKTFMEMYPSVLSRELLFSLDGPFGEWYRSGKVITEKVAEKLGLNHQIVPKMYDLLEEKVLPSKTRRNVITHGDLWANNFMFNDERCVFVDFQLVRYVPAMFDVAQLIYFNAKRDLRDERELELLKCYHESFCQALKKGGIDSPSFADTLDEYEEMRIVGIATINLYFPVHAINEEDIKEILSDPSEGFRDLFCRDRLRLSLETLEKDQKYREVVMSIVREFMDLSRTLFN